MLGLEEVAAPFALTGGNGFIGRAVRRQAANRSAELAPIGRDAGLPEPESRQRLGSVLHLAWPNLVSATASDVACCHESDWADFVSWSVELRRQAARAGAWFVGVGSGIEVFSGGELAEPYRTYVRRKTELREALAEVEPSGFCWLRVHFTFGPFENAQRIVPAAIRAAIEGDVFRCGPLERRRRWLYVDDVADALIESTQRPRAGIWDVAGAVDVSFRELFACIEEAAGARLRLAQAHQPTADSKLDVVRPTRPSPYVRKGAGSADDLRLRLADYVDWLHGTA